jgi:uncharacterized ubiquitin-like protein YukD
MKERVVIVFDMNNSREKYDLDVPMDITANDLIIALNETFSLGINVSKIQSCYLKANNPIVLLKGNRTLREFGVIDGTIVAIDNALLNT